MLFYKAACLKLMQSCTTLPSPCYRQPLPLQVPWTILTASATPPIAGYLDFIDRAIRRLDDAAPEEDFPRERR